MQVKRYRSAARLAASALFLLSLPAVSRAQYAYDIVEAGYGIGSTAQGLNNKGKVVGGFFDPVYQSGHAYLYSNKQSQEIYPTPFFRSFSGASGINDNGQVSTSYQGLAYLYDTRTGTRTGLGPNDVNSVARAINQSGVMVGTSDMVGGAYLFDPRVGIAQGLGDIPGGDGYTSATALNNHNDVVGSAGTKVGYDAFLYHNGVMQDLGTLPGGNGAEATGINDSGDIVGSSNTTDRSRMHAFFYHNGVMRDLGTLYPTDPDSFGVGINNAGDVIGISGNYPFLYHSGTMLNLRQMIDPNDGWQLKYVTAINDRGQIVGYGYHNGFQIGFLMTPRAAVTPAPGSLLVCGLGGGLLALRLRRRYR